MRQDVDTCGQSESLHRVDAAGVRACDFALGELGLDAQLIAAITGHDLDETMRILKTYMHRTTGRASRAIALAAAREAKESGGTSSNFQEKG